MKELPPDVIADEAMAAIMKFLQAGSTGQIVLDVKEGLICGCKLTTTIVSGRRVVASRAPVLH